MTVQCTQIAGRAPNFFGGIECHQSAGGGIRLWVMKGTGVRGGNAVQEQVAS